jgi:hypothetical protein
MTGGDEQTETPQERVQAQHAREVYTDWKKRWLPLQQQLARSVTAAGALDSKERKAAAGRASTDTAIQFQDATDKLEKTLTNSGAGLGSGRSAMAMTGLEDDAAKSRAMGLTISDQQVNDAYIEGLSALTSIGQGERAQVSDALGIQATQSARQSQADAQTSFENRAGLAELGGQFVGYGLQRTMTKGSPGLPEFNQDAGIQPVAPTLA